MLKKLVAATFRLRFSELDHNVTTQAEACGYLKILEFSSPIILNPEVETYYERLIR